MWDNVLGHGEAKAFLENYLHAEQRPHALLFLGPDGVGKRMLAMEFARSLLCEEGSGCGRCASCMMFNLKKNIVSHPDFYLVKRLKDEETGKIKLIGIEQMRNLSKREYGSVRGRGVVCVIDEADCMSADAANKILKFLEEPPEGWVIILLAASEKMLLPTVLSRTAMLRFRPFEVGAVKQLMLGRSRDLTELEAETLARFSEGVPGLAFRFLKKGAFKARDEAVGIISAMPLAAPMSYLDKLSFMDKKVNKEHVLLVINMLQLVLRDLMAVKLGIREGFYNTDIKAHLERIALAWSVRGLKRSLGFVQEAYGALVANVGTRMVFEAMVLQIDQECEE